MPTLKFSLSISNDDYLRYYHQTAGTTDGGQQLQFPAEHLRPLVLHHGVHGRLELELDQHNRFVTLRKPG